MTKARITQRTFGVGLMVLVLAGFTRRQSPDEEAVKSVVTRITDAWNKGDPAGLAAQFTETGTLIAGDGKRVNGRADIERYFAEFRVRLPNLSRFSLVVSSVRFIDADVAIVIGEGGFIEPNEATVSTARQGVQSYVVVRKGGAWRVDLLQRTRSTPPATTQR